MYTNYNIDSALVLDNINDLSEIECVYNNLDVVIYNQNAINIFTMNICSIQKHYDELCIILDNIKTKFEVIILTEAWLGLEGISINNFQMNGYTVHASERNKNKNDGVVIHLKNTLNVISVSELNIHNITALEIVLKKIKN